MDRLWSPWRLEYVTRAGDAATCIFCEAPRRAEDAESLVVFQGQSCYVVLNLYPYNSGHVMVVPYRHVATLGDLTREELLDMGLLLQRAEAALAETYRPNGMNVGINLGSSAGAGVLEHLHVHVVPRWGGDTNFMTVVGDMRVLPESLAATGARLRPIFARLAASG